ncbi:MAG: hypothetical protein H6737_31030 [Alphaproteobacteria bacterium]|nr:hypothetical protein [Alphaproteobacteria bacterium]
MLFLLAALAADPIDAAGRWQHVITLEPSVLVWPHPPDRLQDLAAYGLDPAGGLVLVGEGDILHLSADGVLDRDRWKTPKQYAWLRGHVVVDADGLWGCDRQQGIVQFRRDGGVELIGDPVDVGQGCELYRTADGSFFGWSSLTDTITIFQDDGSIQQQARLPAYVDTTWPKPASAGPCGALADGTSLTMATSKAFETLELVTLDGGLKRTGAVMALDTRSGPVRQALTAAEAWRPRQCVVDGDLVSLAYWSQGVVLSRDGTVQTWLRNGTPLSAANAPPHGTGPWAFDGLEFLGTLDQRTLVAVVPRHGIQLYRPRLKGAADPAAARRLAAAGDFVGAEQHWAAWMAAHPDDAGAELERMKAWTAAGWWGEVIPAGKKHPPDDPRFQEALKARALSLSRWTRRRIRGGGSLFAKGEPTPREDAREALAELAPFAGSTEPAVQEARVRLAAAGRRPYTAERALAQLEALGHTETVDAAFWVYVARGDTARVDALLEGSDPWPDERAARLRLAGDLEAALEAVAKPEEDADRYVRAELLADLGRLDEALHAWTGVVEGMPDHPGAHAGLGLAYLRRGLPELAVQSFLKSLELEENPAVRSNLAAAFAALDDRARVASTLAGLDPTDPVVAHQLAKPGGVGSKKGTLAVLPFDVAGGSVSRVGLGDLLATMAVTELVQGGASVVERARIDAVRAELDLNASAYVDPDAAVRLGKLAGAKELVLGNVAEFPGRVVIDVRRVDVKSGKVLGTGHADASLEVEALRTAVRGAVEAARR